MGKKSSISLQSKEALPSNVLIGEHVPLFSTFSSLDKYFEEFNSRAFKSMCRRRQFRRVNQILLNLLQEAPHDAYLLTAVGGFIGRINKDKVFNETYTFDLFEFWLNHFNDLPLEEKYKIRAKISGKFLPREAYQALFPIGGGTIYPGTHFVTAHLSPDMDTTIASFWGWNDAFSAGIGTGQHLWCLPGGPPPSPMTRVFNDLWGENFFQVFARTSLTLSLNAQDLVNQKNFFRKKGENSINTIEHRLDEHAIVLVDDNGHFIGDWRSSDVEPVRQVSVLFKSCLHWFENNLHIKMISLFATSGLHIDQVQAFANLLCDTTIEQSEPVQEFTEQQKETLDKLLSRVLNLPQGLKASFRDLSEAMNTFEVYEFGLFLKELDNLTFSPLFDTQGNLVNDTSGILNLIERVIIQLDIAIHCMRLHVERLDTAVAIKRHVSVDAPDPFITLKSDVEEIRMRMKSYNFLTVLVEDENDKMYPVGVIWATDLRKPTLGTVSLRDFSSFEEVRMAPYLSIISVIDHHRAAFSTPSTPMAIIGDAQSSNVLIAEIACELNNQYSLGGMTQKNIDAQLAELAKAPQSVKNIRLQRRLLRKASILHNRSDFYVHPQREFAEYLTFLYGICDDTDLLNKVTPRDVQCVAKILNRMKSIVEGKETEIIDFDNIPQDASFARQAAKRILKSPDMFSIYSKIFMSKEKDIEEQLYLCGNGKPSELFADTKEQNKCCRIGQIKIFSSNIVSYLKYRDSILDYWLTSSYDVAFNHPEIDLHIFMISTIASAAEVYEDRPGSTSHQDELWFWGPNTRQAFNHLSSFLLAFQTLPELQNNHPMLELTPQEEFSHEVEDIFRRHFLNIPVKKLPESSAKLKPWAILKYDAGTINSRKSMITPYLPRAIA
ncbi:MAG: hypothetical protein WC222_08025 [Parachlamydiales bacterium]